MEVSQSSTQPLKSTHEQSVVEASSPRPGVPCLHSTRLYSVDSSTGLSTQMIEKMNSFLKELDLPSNPLPTKTVCDMVDKIKQDTITLLCLQDAILEREKELVTIAQNNSKSK